MSKLCYDHLGNKFYSISEMCNFYGINESTYKNRIKNGWSIEKALIVNKKEITDFKGITYNTIKDMCEYYNIPRNIYYNRLKRGWSQEKILTTPIRNIRNIKNDIIKDHIGNKFSSISEMCKFYNITINSYYCRINKGWSLEKALTTPLRQHKKQVKDHLGNVFNTQKEMCDYYNIDTETYRNRLQREWTHEKALTTPLLKYIIKDHLGNKFSSIKEMCKYYNIKNGTYRGRIKIGWSQEKALTTPINYIKINNIKGTYVYTYNNQYYYKCKLPNSEQKQILTLEQINNYKEN